MTAYFINRYGRVHFLISMHLGADCDPPWASQESMGNFPHILALVHSKNKARSPASLWNQLVHTSGTPGFTVVPRGTAPQTALLSQPMWLAFMSPRGWQ